MRMYDSVPSREVCGESLLVSDCSLITKVALPCSPLQTWTHTCAFVCVCVEADIDGRHQTRSDADLGPHG